MKLLILIIAVSLSLNACTSDKQKVNSDNSNPAMSEQLNLQGAWVLKDYTTDIEKTKSPLKSAEKLTGLVSFYVDTIFKNDSVKVAGSWNNHEGIIFTVYSKKAEKSNHLKTDLQDYEEPSNYFEFGFETTEKETILTLFHYDKSNKLLDSKQFTKILDKQNNTDPTYGLQYFVNQKLVSGNYTMTDDKNAKSKVTFTNDGTVTGFPNFKNYYISTDFSGGPTPTFDEIIIDLNLPTQRNFIFKRGENSLDIFSTKGNEADDDVKPDKLKYHLVKE